MKHYDQAAQSTDLKEAVELFLALNEDEKELILERIKEILKNN